MKYNIFLEGTRVSLVVIDINILNKTDWYKWFNNKRLTTFIKQGYFPNTKAKQKKYFLESVLSNSRLQLGIINKLTKKLIGMVALYNIDYFDRTCDISMVLNNDRKNINSIFFFKEAQILLIEHAFEKLNINRISAACNDINLLKINKKLFGFKQEGIMRDRDYIQGKYYNRYILGLLKSDWLRFNKK